MKQVLTLNSTTRELILKRTYNRLFKVPKKQYLFIHTDEIVPNYLEYIPNPSKKNPNFFGTLYGVGIIGKPPIKLGYVWENKDEFEISSIDKNNKYLVSRIGNEKLILEDENKKKEIKILKNESLDDLICSTTIGEFCDKPLLIQQFPMVLLGLNGISNLDDY